MTHVARVYNLVAGTEVGTEMRVGIAAVLIGGCNCGPTEVRSHLQSEVATASGLAFEHEADGAAPALGLSLATPGLEVEGDAIGLRDALASGGAGELGRTSVVVREANASTGAVDVQLTAFYPHLPALTRIDATVRGTVESDDLSAELLREALARHILDLLAERRPENAALPAEAGPIRDVAVGNARECFLHEGGEVRCRFGNVPSGVALPVPDMTGIVELAAGDSTVCGRRENGTVRCITQGANESVESYRAVEVCGLAGARTISVSNDYGCSKGDGGSLECWRVPGRDEECRPSIEIPEGIDPPIEEVVVGYSRACARTSTGLFCWRPGQAASPIAGGTALRHLAAHLAICGVESERTVRCIHPNDGSTFEPAELPEPPVSLAFTADWILARLESGTVVRYAAGAPEPIAGLTDVITLDASLTTACAVTRGGEAWCWSANSDTPVRVAR